MTFRRLYSKWIRLGTVIAASIGLDWEIERRLLEQSPPPSSRFLDLLLAPGYYIGLIITDTHGGPIQMAITSIVNVAFFTALIYGFTNLLIWVISQGRRKAVGSG